MMTQWRLHGFTIISRLAYPHSNPGPPAGPPYEQGCQHHGYPPFQPPSAYRPRGYPPWQSPISEFAHYGSPLRGYHPYPPQWSIRKTSEIFVFDTRLRKYL